jgi:hypothetical protein
MQHLYISYPPDDHEFAHRLVTDLQDGGYPVFVDPVTQAGTMAWAAETRRAIRGCGAMIMILSPEEGRRTGIRHEGILARRRHKPVVVVLRSPGDVPRYLEHATMVDGTRPYEAVLPDVLAAVPSPASLLLSPDPAAQIRPPRRPPRLISRKQRRRRFLVAVTLVVAGVLLGIAFGIIPV